MSSKYITWTTVKLRKELGQRSASTKGRKQDLIERLEAYDRNENFMGPVFINNEEQLDWPVNGFKELTVAARNTVPILLRAQVEFYFDQYVASDFQTVLEKGQKLLDAIRIRACSFMKVDGSCFFSGLVSAAMKKKVSYTVKLELDDGGDVLRSDCECPAGKGMHGVCKHVACLLGMLINFSKNGQLHTQKSCTAELQTFHQPQKLYQGSPIKSQNMTQTRTCSSEDPRPMKYRNNSGYNDWVRSAVINYCGHSQQDLAIRYIYGKADLQTAIWDHNYLEKPFPSYWIENSLKMTAEEIANIEQQTRSQSQSKLWMRQRKWRLTASNFGTICHMTDKRNTDKLCEQLFYPQNLKTPAVLYGKRFESEARSKFEQLFGKSVNACGLFISEDFPFLAASPDGIILEEQALIEIKCPYSCKDDVITSANLKYLEDIQGSLHLKKSSQYFCQVQGQMAISNVHKCYFVVFSKNSLIVDCIEFDEEYWKTFMVPKLSHFYEIYCNFITKMM